MAVLLASFLNAMVIFGAHTLTGLSPLHQPAIILFGATIALSALHLLLLLRRHPTLHSLLSIIESLTLGFIFFYLIAILYGALLLKHYVANVAWALWMSSLTLLPSLLLLGRLRDPAVHPTYKRVICHLNFQSTTETLLYFHLMGVIVGGWAGCVVIPLDWGRIWQNWPIPNMIGSTIGSLFGILVGICLDGWLRKVKIVNVKAKGAIITPKSTAGQKPPTSTPSRGRPRKQVTESSAAKKSTANSPGRAVSRGRPKKAVSSPSKSPPRSPSLRKKVISNDKIELPVVIADEKVNGARSASRMRTPRRVKKSSRSPSRTPAPASARSVSQTPRRSTRMQ